MTRSVAEAPTFIAGCGSLQLPITGTPSEVVRLTSEGVSFEKPPVQFTQCGFTSQSAVGALDQPASGIDSGVPGLPAYHSCSPLRP